MNFIYNIIYLGEMFLKIFFDNQLFEKNIVLLLIYFEISFVVCVCRFFRVVIFVVYCKIIYMYGVMLSYSDIFMLFIFFDVLIRGYWFWK